MENKEELKPCPCCKGKASIGMPAPHYRYGDEQDGWEVDLSCDVCGLGMSKGFRDIAEFNIIRDKLLSLWNTRQPDTELVKFARKVIGANCWGYDSMDGLDIQELAEVLGLLEQHTATKEDVDDESDFEVEDRIYKFSELLKEKD